jgi:hypothetical protein
VDLTGSRLRIPSTYFDLFFLGSFFRLVPANSLSCFLLIDFAICLEAPLSFDFFISPRLAARAAPAAICCFFDLAGIPDYRARPDRYAYRADRYDLCPERGDTSAPQPDSNTERRYKVAGSGLSTKLSQSDAAFGKNMYSFQPGERRTLRSAAFSFLRFGEILDFREHIAHASARTAAETFEAFFDDA